jgi:ATP-dependent Lon protease
MTKDTNQRAIVRKETKKSKKRDEIIKKKKNHESSDDDDESYHSSDSEEEMDDHEYRKFLQKIFPSKHLEKKIKAGEKLKKTIEVEEETEEEDDEKLLKKKNKKQKPSKKVAVSEDEEDEEKLKKKSKKQSSKKKTKKEETEDEDTEDEEEEEEDTEEEDEKPNKKKTNKFNIIFTIGGANQDEDEDEWEDYDEDDDNWEDADESETEDEDESVSTSETEDEDEDDEETEDEEEKVALKKKNKSVKKEKEQKQTNDNNEELESIKPNDDEFLVQLKEIYGKNKSSKLVEKCINICEEDIKVNKKKQEKKEKKHKEKNVRIFRKIIKDKNTMNDFYFFEKLELEEQKKIIKELKEINTITRVEKPYRISLLEANIPTLFKSAAIKKINSLRYMEPGSGEFYKIKNWVDTFMRIPFDKFETLPISIEDGVEKCHEFMENAQKTLNDAVYGMNDAKMQIMQMLGQLLTNPKAIGTAIAIHGPAGTGKTSIVKEGISKILNRPFAFIALGGATDSSFLEGHSYTYEGSTWGKIVQILIDSKCMNPVIYFDELDKISDTPRGEEITGILTHLTDTSQNSQYHDKYFAEIDFDLSKCLFIFSYNDESKVNPILKDRMYRIQTKGYNQKQKTIISNQYLLPKIREQVKFEEKQIIIPDETIHYIIDTHCNKEDGVRNLKRCLEIIYTKLNLYRLMKSDTNLFEEDMTLKVEFPFTVTKDIIDKLIKRDKDNVSALYSMYV